MKKNVLQQILSRPLRTIRRRNAGDLCNKALIHASYGDYCIALQHLLGIFSLLREDPDNIRIQSEYVQKIWSAIKTEAFETLGDTSIGCDCVSIEEHLKRIKRLHHLTDDDLSRLNDADKILLSAGSEPVSRKHIVKMRSALRCS